MEYRKAPAGGHKRALVLAGGGAKGAYQAGAWKALKEVGYQFDIVTGCSVGAINAAMFVAGDLDKVIRLWKELTTEMVLDVDFPDEFESEKEKREAIRKIVLEAVKEKALDQHPLYEMLKEIIPVDIIYDSPIQLGINTVTFPHLKPVLINKENTPKEKLIDYIMASAACFPGMKPWVIDGVEYVDGGYYDREPIQQAIDMGATEVVCIGLHGFGVNRPFDRTKAIVMQVAPSGDLGEALVFDPSDSPRKIQMGYEDTLRAFGIDPETKQPIHKKTDKKD